VAITPDGRYALSSSGNTGNPTPTPRGDDCTVRVWDLKNGRQHLCLFGHTQTVFCVVVSSDGRRALSGSFDRTVRLWDLQTGKELQRFEAPSALWDVAISPDGRSALSAGWDGVVRLWRLPDRAEGAGK
jgi:WD40 repeat protein